MVCVRKISRIHFFLEFIKSPLRHVHVHILKKTKVVFVYNKFIFEILIELITFHS